MTYLRVILAILVIDACFACNDRIDVQTHDQQNAELIRLLNTGDSLTREINSDQSETAWLRYMEKQCGLDSLNNGFDSVQIRVKYGCFLYGSDRLVILKFVSGKWSAEIRELKYDSGDRITQRIKHEKPKSGWDSLITRLFNLQILVLPNLEKIEGFKEESVNDGCWVGVEIATKKCYRNYDYSNPDLYTDQLWQAKNVLGILTFLNEEFEIENWPSHHLRSTGGKLKWIPNTNE